MVQRSAIQTSTNVASVLLSNKTAHISLRNESKWRLGDGNGAIPTTAQASGLDREGGTANGRMEYNAAITMDNYIMVWRFSRIRTIVILELLPYWSYARLGRSASFQLWLNDRWNHAMQQRTAV